MNLLDIFHGIQKASQPKRQQQIRADFPIFVFSGAHDPVSKETTGLKNLLHAYRQSGLEKVTYTIYPNGRHDMIHEKNKLDVFQDIQTFIAQVVEQK